MRFRLVVVACCFIGCGPPQAVDRVASARGTGGTGRIDARAGSGGAGAPVAGSPGAGGSGVSTGGVDGIGGSMAPPDVGPGIGGSGTGGSGGSAGSGTGGSAGTGPSDAAMEPTSPPPDAAPPPPDTAPPPVDAPPMAVCPMPAADEFIASFRGALITDRVGDRGGTNWSVLTGTDSIPGVAGMVALGTGPARCGNTDFLRFTGTAVATRAPIIRAQLRENSGGAPQYVNASGFQGVRMFLRSTNGGRARVKLPDRNTATIGGVCTLCSDHFALEVDVTSDWQLFKIPFADLKQAGTGDPQPALASNALWAIEITAPKTAQFTLEVDDISFFR